jgi:rhodanese-related sulfurtransferase
MASAAMTEQAEARPVGRVTVDDLLADARAGLARLDSATAHAALAMGALLIDIRSDAQRATDGIVPGSLVIGRNVLEWRCDPSCPAHDRRIQNLDARLIVMCDGGYQSSLAAATLQRLGLTHATDLIGGFRAWRAAGLPVHPLRDGGLMRAIDCPCGHHLEAADDESLFRTAREHIDLEHPKMDRSHAQLRERIVADAYDVMQAPA